MSTENATSWTPGTGDAPIRVFLVDDQMLVRTGFRMLIDAQDDMTVVGEAPDGAQAVAALARPAGTVGGAAVGGAAIGGAAIGGAAIGGAAIGGAAAGGGGRPVADVVLMDIRMPVMDGVEATSRIVAAATGSAAVDSTLPDGIPPGPKVLVLTTFDIDEYVYAALRAGASGFLLKDARPDDLLAAIRAVAAGDSVVAPSATRRLIATVLHALPGADRADASRLEVLTAREREVLQLVAIGRSNGEIAAELFMAEATVKTHIGHLLAKLQIRDRVGLVVLAYETGLVTA